jgi:hypothetical protein
MRAIEQYRAQDAVEPGAGAQLRARHAAEHAEPSAWEDSLALVGLLVLVGLAAGAIWVAWVVLRAGMRLLA